MKKVRLIVLSFSFSSAAAGEARLEKLWQSDDVLQVPRIVRIWGHYVRSETVGAS